MMDGFIAFDWILFVATAVLSVCFLTGHGEKIVRAFDSNSDLVRRKMTPEEKAKFLRICGIFCVILCAMSLLLILFHKVPIVPFLAIAVAVADLVFFAVYTKKHFPPNTKF